MGLSRCSAEATMKRLQCSQQLLERFPNERSARSIWLTDKKTYSPLPRQAILKMITFTQLKHRKGTFQKGDLYTNVNISAEVSWYQLVCLEWGKQVLCSLIQAPK